MDALEFTIASAHSLYEYEVIHACYVHAHVSKYNDIICDQTCMYILYSLVQCRSLSPFAGCSTAFQ